MKSFELKPTEENLLSAYKNDQIGRNTDIHAFVDILNSLEDSCSIAIEVHGEAVRLFLSSRQK